MYKKILFSFFDTKVSCLMIRKSVHSDKNSNDIKPHVTKSNECIFFPLNLHPTFVNMAFCTFLSLEQYDNPICYLSSNGSIDTFGERVIGFANSLFLFY